MKPESETGASWEAPKTATPQTEFAEDSMEGYVGPGRNKMPDDRVGITHKFTLAGHDGYITANLDDDGKLGELFLHGIGKEGSTMEGLVQGFAMMTSIALQYGAPPDMLCRKLAHMRFEPHGKTDNEEIPEAHSLMDYFAQWIALRFGDETLQQEMAAIRDEMRRY